MPVPVHDHAKLIFVRMEKIPVGDAPLSIYLYEVYIRS